MQLKLRNWQNLLKSEKVNDRLTIYSGNENSDKSSFAEDVKAGFYLIQKELQPKYFYDSEGSELFEKICTTPEYYVTRTETSILEECSDDIINCSGGIESICELGSGASLKTRYLINSFIKQLGALHYVPIDVSPILKSSSLGLCSEINDIKISGILSEYENGLDISNSLFPEPKLIIFLGSSIGNFDLYDAKKFIKSVSESMIDEDYLLIGFDMVKSKNILHPAYNDKEGYTAKFNLNVLDRINKELGGNFDLNEFEHIAFFNEALSRIEMHLVSKINQLVYIGKLNEIFRFKIDETIHTENSYKFTDQMISSLAENAGLNIINKWTDEKNYFSLVLFSKRKFGPGKLF